MGVVLWRSCWTTIVATVLVASGGADRGDVRSSFDWPTTAGDFHQMLQRYPNPMSVRNFDRHRPSKSAAGLPPEAAMAEMQCGLKLLSIMRAFCWTQLDVELNDGHQDGNGGDHVLPPIIPPSLAQSLTTDSCGAPLLTTSRFCTASAANAVVQSFRPWSGPAEDLEMRVGKRTNRTYTGETLALSRVGRNDGDSTARQREQQEQEQEQLRQRMRALIHYYAITRIG